MTAHAPHRIEVRPPGPEARGEPALFLDRDGVINDRRPALVRTWGDFSFRPRALQAFRLAAEHNVPVFVATNQAWVGMGYFSLGDLVDTHERMIRAIEAAGGRVDAVYACIHPLECRCRKPMPGMLEAAAKDYGVDLSRSWMVGDNRKDMRAGHAVHAGTVLVDPRLRTWVQRARAHADHVAPDVYEAAVHALRAMGRLPGPDAARHEPAASGE